MLKLFAYAASRHKRTSKYQFWTHENHAELIYSNRFMKQKLSYIHQNPVVAGFVDKAEGYIYSSAKNYAGEKGLIDVEILPIDWNTL